MQNPAQKLSESLNANANAMMNWNVCAEMKKLAAGGEGQFGKDVDRGTNATLTDGKTTFKLTGKMTFKAGRDVLARFVAGDPKATYESLTKAADRNKVHLLMAVLSQETEKVGENGSAYTMDAREADMAFQINPPKGKEAVRVYTVQKLDDGEITLHYTMDKPIKDIDDGTTGGLGFNLGEGSKFTCTIDYTLKGIEFNRLADLDYSKFDDKEGYKVFNKPIGKTPNGDSIYRDHKLEKVVDTFADEFKIESECKMEISFKLNPSDEDLPLMGVNNLEDGKIVINP